MTQLPLPRDNSKMRMGLKAATLQIALLAMVLRAVMPVGWMPSTQAGAAPIMPCPGMDSMAGMHHKMPAPPHKSDHAKSTYCTCAAVAQLGTPAPDAAGPALAQSCSRVAFAATHDAPRVASLYRANAARAPPRSA